VVIWIPCVCFRSFETWFTEMITNKERCSLREMKIIFDVDRRKSLESFAEKASKVTKVAEHPAWAKLWDNSFDLG